MIFMTFSFLWWLSIVKTVNVGKTTTTTTTTTTPWLVHATNTLLIEVAFIFVWRFWQKVIKQIGTELINKGKGKEERNKLHCKGKEFDVANWIYFKGYCEWIKMRSKHKIQKEKYSTKDKKILTSKLRFRGTFSEVLYFRTFR